ncbi:MAG: tRNA-dihydrouridine synthase family protein [Candidatus Cloacimonetes bacterium]|nr:tRNA-dihydrouridine synthase family protein [Candidatus Cloacimonadota bacterium]
MKKKKVSNNTDGFVLGDTIIYPPVCSAPMAGYSNQATRVLYSKFSCPLNVSEMVSAKALNKNNLRTWNYITKSEDEALLWIQLFGGDPIELQNAVISVQERLTVSAIDLNLGCPVKKISKNLAGAQLMKDPHRVFEIVKSMVEFAEVPITVKMRSGLKGDHQQAIEVAKACEEAGASLITIHPRSKEQKFTGFANWEIIEEIKSLISIPVLGNGDVKTLQDYLDMREQTKCDGVMIGRGAVGNPWIFQEIYNYHYEKDQKVIKNQSKIALDHFLLELKHSTYIKNEYLRLRKSLPNYFKNSPHYDEITQKVQSCESNQELQEFLRSLTE